MLEPAIERNNPAGERRVLISKAMLNERVRQWRIREDVVEKDYVIGWALWAIGSEPHLAGAWAFKGGTCLKKCYVDTPRFSEDLDFTILPGGPSEPDEVQEILEGLVRKLHMESGLDFTGRSPRVLTRPNGRSAECSIYYRGPRNPPGYARIKLDLSIVEKVICPTVVRVIEHDYPDSLPSPAEVRCYAFEEVFAEKLRALGERTRPRDLYDVITLFRQKGLLPSSSSVRSLFKRKCEAKGLTEFTLESIQTSPFRAELETEWDNMLAHQLSELPPLAEFWEELPSLFDWLHS